jgi:hypothetical protein
VVRRRSDAGSLSEAGHEDEAKELLKIASSYQDVEDRLAGYANEVKAGRIVRGKTELQSKRFGHSSSTSNYDKYRPLRARTSAGLFAPLILD